MRERAAVRRGPAMRVREPVAVPRGLVVRVRESVAVPQGMAVLRSPAAVRGLAMEERSVKAPLRNPPRLRGHRPAAD